MKCTIPEISWHNRGPVLSVDFQRGVFELSGVKFRRLATGGTDSHVLIWHVTINETGEATVKCVADLERHQKAVNVVRFSPSAEILASGDDESIIILWKQREGSDNPILPVDDSINNEQWNSLKTLKGHVEDIYDLCWSPDSTMLASGSVDNSVILWNVEKGKKISMLSDYHKGFPQGVAWDPLNKYISTISSDRFLRLISVNTKKTLCRVSRSRIPTPPDNGLEGKLVRLFHDETFKSFFRRLSFTPDGSLIIVPSGIIEPHNSVEKITHCTVVFSRHSVKEPIAILPSLNEPTNAVSCCPVYFKLRDKGPTALIALPYRIVFAVATDNSVYIYDTQQISPIAIISNIHYTRLTDVTWSSDGRILIASSSDGYCSIIYFQEDELGEVYTMPLPVNVTATKNAAQEDVKITKQMSSPLVELDVNAVDNNLCQEKNKEQKTDQPMQIDSDLNGYDQNDKKTDTADEEEDFKLVLEDTVVDNDKNDKTSEKLTPPKCDKPPTIISARTPRRVQLITLSSPKSAKKE